MSISTTSATPRSTSRIAVVCPTNPLPTTVTRMMDSSPRDGPILSTRLPAPRAVRHGEGRIGLLGLGLPSADGSAARRWCLDWSTGRKWPTWKRSRSSSPISERATLRVGGRLPEDRPDQTRTDVEVEAMAMAPIPTPEVLWRKPPVLALAALPGRHSAASASRRPRRRRRGPRAVPPHGCCTTRRCRHGPVGASTRSHRTSTANASGSSRTSVLPPTWSRATAGCRGCAPALDTRVHARRPADHPRVRRR
jgi:hypothetical protein